MAAACQILRLPLKSVIPLLSRRSATVPNAHSFPFIGRHRFFSDSRCLAGGISASKYAQGQAEDYDTFAVEARKDGEHLISLIKQVSPAKDRRTILDLGCGPGPHTAPLAEYAGEGGRVIGVDPDEARLKIARQKYERKFNNVEFVKGTGEDFPEGPYDLVFANYVLIWIKDQAPLFKKVYENLQHGGLFAFNTIVKGPPIGPQLLSLMDSHAAEDMKQSLLNNFVPPEVHDDLAASHGFITTHRDVSPREFVFPHIDHVMRWIFGVTHGKFDLDRYQAKIESFKQQFGDKPVRGDLTTMVNATFILTKPCRY